ncbi:MAG TPA: four-carbon acid sugar kinase family protein [Symbiobacteriaceae bacterium]|nr:four-carbon acid sugar kinase family protein [Symbiobacteriaceae bacterium]
MTWSDKQNALIGVIADDLTGANATGILLRRKGYRTASLTGMDWPSGGLAGYDCVSMNTESRAVPAETAYERVEKAAQLIGENGGRPLAKRIDSTLRGNLGPELDALLAVLGPESMAVVTGAFPASGRTTVDGNHYVNGVLLAETAVRHDPLCPVTESHVPTLLAKQTKLPIGRLSLQVVRQGADRIATELKELANAGIRLVCADAETNEDIAALGAGMAKSHLHVVAADPGPLTAAYVGSLMGHRRRRVLVVAGSVTPNTREQLDTLEKQLDAALLTVDAGLLAQGGTVAAGEVDRVVAGLAALPAEQVVLGVRTSPMMTLPDRHAAEAIAAGFAEVALRSIDAMPEIAGVYTSGGDITLAVCRRMGSRAINLVEEVLPLAVAGRLLGGHQPGLPIVTKGGLVGGADAAVQCVSYILKEVQNYG